MSQDGAAAGAAQRAASGAGRVVRAFKVLPAERRLAAYAALGMIITLFLPWYQVTVIAPNKSSLLSAHATITGWGAFSFVEAAVLLVATGVLTLLFQRAEGRAFHVPGGDGWVVTAAGAWTCVLVVWRIFDKQGTDVHGAGATTSGIEWGIFIALGVAAFLTYAGSRIRAAHTPEPALPGEGESGRGGPSAADDTTRVRRRAQADRGSIPPDRSPVRSPRPVAADEPATRALVGEPALADGPAATRVRAGEPAAAPALAEDPEATLVRRRPARPAGGPERRDDPAPAGPSEDQLTIPFDVGDGS